MCTMRFVRVRDCVERPFLSPPSTNTSWVSPTSAAASLGRDALLQRDEPVEPRPARPPWGPAPRSSPPSCPDGASTGTCTRCRNGRLPPPRASARSRCSVSPGKPTMMSVETAIPSIAVRMRSSQPRYRSRRYDRCMRRSTASDPDCSGKWMCSQTDGVSAMASMTSGVKSCGCGLVNRTRRIPSTAPTCRRRSANSGVRDDPGTVTSRPYVFTFWPSRVTSTTPRAASPWHLGQDVADGAGALRPPHERHDAERAGVVAPRRDRDPRAERVVAGRRAARSGTSPSARVRPSGGPRSPSVPTGPGGAAARGSRRPRRPKGHDAGSRPGPSGRGTR